MDQFDGALRKRYRGKVSLRCSERVGDQKDRGVERGGKGDENLLQKKPKVI